MSFIKLQPINDGKKNSILSCIGILNPEESREQILNIDSLDGKPEYIKIDVVTYALQSGLVATLWWENIQDDSLIFPLEARGKLEFVSFGGLQNPKYEGHTRHLKIRVENFNKEHEGHFMILLDLTKVGK